jgi:hypothetical protein
MGGQPGAARFELSATPTVSALLQPPTPTTYGRGHFPASRRSPRAAVPFGPYNSMAVAQFGPLPL